MKSLYHDGIIVLAREKVVRNYSFLKIILHPLTKKLRNNLFRSFFTIYTIALQNYQLTL